MRNRAWTTASLLIRFAVCWALLALPPAFAADPPRRIAIAPFAVLGQEDVRPVAALLPRLLASRLMALAGVDAPLLPAGEKPPADAAAEIDAPLLLQGTVSRLGKGYSIDVDVTDRAAGRSAGVFFVSAATEDEIIPQVGRLAEEISDRLFHVKPAARPAAAPAAPSAPQAVPAPVPALPPAASTASAPSAPAPSSPDRLPSSLRKAGQSDRIVDELFGVVSVGDGKGAGELAAWGRSTIYFFREQGGALHPSGRVSRELNHHILNLDTADLDGDGVPEILVTDRVNERIESFVLRRRGDLWEEIAEKVPYYLVVLADRGGKRQVAGQSPGMDAPFHGRFLSLEWKDGKFVEAGPLPLDAGMQPLSVSGILGLSSARFGDSERFLFTEEAGYIRLLDDRSKTVYKGKTRYGASSDRFEWGPYLQMEGRRASILVRQAPRVLAFREGAPLLLAPQPRKAGIVSRITGGETDGSRLVLLRWEDGEFVEQAASKPTDFQITGADLMSSSPVPGALFAAAVIEQPAGVFQERISRVVLFTAE